MRTGSERWLRRCELVSFNRYGGAANGERYDSVNALDFDIIGFILMIRSLIIYRRNVCRLYIVAVGFFSLLWLSALECAASLMTCCFCRYSSPTLRLLSSSVWTPFLFVAALGRLLGFPTPLDFVSVVVCWVCFAARPHLQSSPCDDLQSSWRWCCSPVQYSWRICRSISALDGPSIAPATQGFLVYVLGL